MNDTGVKQQIVEKIRDATNILVTVSQSPTVDELSAALGLTVMLNKMNKHATAVFSGNIPPAITFLDPKKTFENTVDSLRDFIIALDKEKADHLRYKVEGDVVKIFITPYRTTISDKDLDFSQGDYNVELVLALGVTSQDQLDKALEAHGRIFHDATVATISVGDNKSSLGSIDWNERNASSLSEVVVSLSDTLRSDKNLLDEQSATAFLTGIVAATNRFSNNLTTSKAMTIAAQLMAAGANQQLIASKLEEAEAISESEQEKETKDDSSNKDGTTSLSEGKASKVKKDKSDTKEDASEKAAEEPEEKQDRAGELTISHEKQGTLDEVAAQTADEQTDAAAEHAKEKLAAQLGGDQSTGDTISSEDELAKELAAVAPSESATPSVADLQKDIAAADAEIEQAAEEVMAPVPETLPEPLTAPQPQAEPLEPSLGGTLNATTEEAAATKRREEASDRNRTILTHDAGSYVGNSAPTYSAPLNAASDPNLQDHKPLQDPMAEPNFMNQGSSPTFTAPALQPIAQTLADLDDVHRTPHEAARSDIDAAFAAQDEMTQPAAQEPATMVPPLPPMPDFTTLPPLPPMPGQMPPQMDPGMPQQPANPYMPPMDPAPLQPQGGPSDPAQFQIPGQK